MVITTTIRRPLVNTTSAILVASSDGELLPNTNYDNGDSLTTGYIVFPSNITDAIWRTLYIQKLRVVVYSEVTTPDFPSFRLIFTTRTDSSLTKGEPIVFTPSLAVTDILGTVDITKNKWKSIGFYLYEQIVDSFIVLPIVIIKDFYSFGLITEVGSFPNRTKVIFEIYGEIC